MSESYLSNVDMHEYSEREKAAILDAQRIIREHHPVVLGDCLDKKTTIKVPEAYLPLLEDIRHLTVDQNNPNRTTIKQQEQIWKSLQKYGWAYPVVTNKDEFILMGNRELWFACNMGSFLFLFYGCLLATLTEGCSARFSISSEANITGSLMRRIFAHN